MKWYHRTGSLVIGFLILGPFILPVVWSNPRFSPRAKIVITAVILLLTYWLVAATTRLFTDYFKLYDQILKGTY